MIVPDDMGEPTDDVLEQVSDAMMRLDDQFRLLEPIGLVEYRPVDEALMAEAEDRAEEPVRAAVDDEDVSRYGMVRLTPLGLYGIRARMLEAGVDAPAVGDLADKGADALLDGARRVPASGRAGRDRAVARPAASPLAAAASCWPPPGATTRARPLRRLRCQQALSPGRAGGRAGGPRGAGRPGAGRARPGLAGRARRGGRAGAGPEMVFWLTVDTIAAQLAADGETGGAARPWWRGWSASTAGSSTRPGGWSTRRRRTCWRRWAGSTRTRRRPRRPARRRSRRGRSRAGGMRPGCAGSVGPVGSSRGRAA